MGEPLVQFDSAAQELLGQEEKLDQNSKINFSKNFILFFYLIERKFSISFGNSRILSRNLKAST